MTHISLVNVKFLSPANDTGRQVGLYLRGLSVSQLIAGVLLHLILLMPHGRSLFPKLSLALIIPVLLGGLAGAFWQPLKMNRAATGVSSLLSVLLAMVNACSLLRMGLFDLLCQPFVPILLVMGWLMVSAIAVGVQEVP